MSATWQAGDTQPPIRFRLTQNVDGAYVPFDLTGKTVKLRFSEKGQPALWEREVSIDDPETGGLCHYDWAADDLAESGEFEAQLVLELGGEQVRLTPIFAITVARSVPTTV